MKPDFALDFRDNQIALLHRQEGGWAIVGRVEMDDPDLDAAMGYLRATALGLSPRGVSAKLILPNEAILYTSVAGLPYDVRQRAAQVGAALVGRTPYDVADLVYDWTDSGDTAHIAVIARETLAEAEHFASQHRFNPVSFAALPNQGAYEGEVWFGPTQLSAALLARGEVVERDDVTVFAPEPDAQAAATLQASDFEMGAENLPEDTPPQGEEFAQEQTPQDANPSAYEQISPPETGHVDEVAVLDEIARKAEDTGLDFAADGAGHPEASGALDFEKAQPDTETPPDSAPAELNEPVSERAPEETAELGTDATASQTANAPVEAAFDLRANAAQQEPPAIDSFGAVMDATPEHSADGDGSTDDEAPMAIDVPLMDEPDAPEPKKPQGKAEQMLAAFAARRAAALSKAEAATNSARRDPVMTATQVAPDTADLAAQEPAAPIDNGAPVSDLDGTNTDPPNSELPDTDPDTAASAPKLGAAQRLNGQDTGANAPPDIASLPQQRPTAVKHVPAKILPTKPQNLSSMPAAKPRRSGGAKLGWLLTAILLISLAAAAAMSTYVLETVNSFFQSAPASNVAQTSVVNAEPVVELNKLPVPPNLSETTAQALSTGAADKLTLASRTAAPSAAPDLPEMAQTLAPSADISAPDLKLPDLPNSALPQMASARQVQPDTAEQITAVASRPSTAPIARPDTISGANAVLGAARPQSRPAVVLAAALAAKPPTAPAGQTAQSQPYADPALAGARPKLRPAGILAAGREARLSSAPASLVAGAESAAIEDALTSLATDVAAPETAAPDPNRSALALDVSRLPAPRPKGLKAAYETSLASAPLAVPEPAAPPVEEVVARAPTAAETEEDITLDGRAGTRSVVAKQATERNAINLRNTNLVGIFGSNANRYALIRQPNGTFKKLKVGDRFDGGRIAAITESELRYDKGGNMLALRMP
jgi:hypothetical protein